MRVITNKFKYNDLSIDFVETNGMNGKIGFRVFHKKELRAAPIFYLPGRWQNSLLWAFDYPERDFRFFFANCGYLVGSMDYQTRAVRKNHAVKNTEWGTKDMINDIVLCINTFASYCKCDEILLAGYSMGAALGFMLPHDQLKVRINGFIALDGGHKNAEHTMFMPGMHSEFNSNAEIDPSLMNSTADPRFRKYAIEKVARLQSSDRITHHFTHDLDNDVLRYLLIENLSWSTRQVEEMKWMAYIDGNHLLNFDQNTQKIKCPIFCVAAIKEEAEIDMHRTVSSARMTSSTNINILSLPGWTHLDVVTSNQTPRKIWIPLQHWLEANC